MDLRGRKVFLLGDSLSARANGPIAYDASAIKLTGSPGDLLATKLRSAGAASVRVNAKVGRSAVSLFSKEDGPTILANEARLRPDLVVVFLGTNDIGYGTGPDVQAFARILAAFAAGTPFLVLGPPKFAGARAAVLNAGAETVYATERVVFGGAVVDTRPLTPTSGRAGDGIHFALLGARAYADKLMQAIAAAPQPPSWRPTAGPASGGAAPGAGGAVGPASASNAWRWSVAGSMIGLTMVGVGAVYWRKKRRLAGLGAGGELIPGGLAPGGRCPTGTDPRQIRRGVAVEMEHTSDRAVAREIACDHLTEDPRYYTKLAQVEGDGLGAIRDRVIGVDYPAEVVHGTTKKSAQAFLQRRDLPERERTRTLSEFGPSVLYVAEKTAPHQAVMFGTQGGRTLLALQLAPGRRVLDVASEMQRRPFVGDTGAIAFKGRPTITDDMAQWLAERRATRGLKPVDPAIIDPTSPAFDRRGYPDLLATYARDRGYAAVRFTDETVVVDPTAVVSARRLKPAEATALKTVPRRLPAIGPASLYTRDFEPDDGLAAPTVAVLDTKPFLDIDPEDHEIVKVWSVEDEDEIDGVELRSRVHPARYALAHRTTYDAGPHGKWQVSEFDEEGAVGDSKRERLVDALASRASPVEYEVVKVHAKAERKPLRGDDDGRMAHRPNDEGPPAHDLLEGGLAPRDIYEHPEWYTGYTEGEIFHQTIRQLRHARAWADRKPSVFIYRAMPKVSAGGFRTGDWVTLSEQYAKNEAETEGVPVYVARVPAKDVRWAGDDLMEFGYWGPPVKGKISWQRRLPRKKAA